MINTICLLFLSCYDTSVLDTANVTAYGTNEIMSFSITREKYRSYYEIK